MTKNSARRIPVACSLDQAAAETQLNGWQSVGKHRLSVEELPDGATVRYPLHVQQTLQRLIEQERQCCAFFDLEASVNADHIEVSIRSDQPDGKAVVDLLLGLPSASA